MAILTPNNKIYTLSTILNILGLLGISIVLLLAFYYQLVKYDLPCPLCLLQRVGIIMIGCGLLFNIRFGVSGTHYGIILIGSLVTGMVSTRQMFLHILPGDSGYGTTFLYLHFYTWALLLSIATVLAVAILLIVGSQRLITTRSVIIDLLSKGICILFVLIILGNLVSTFLECGGGQCADNPVQYLWLSK